jgi:hypothetical protein
MSASERQKDGSTIENFLSFKNRLSALQLSHLEILPAMAYWDITFFDHCLFADDKMELLEKTIHEILFPKVEFLRTDFCARRNLDTDAPETKAWRSAKCDVQVLWSHIHHKRDVFVTSDKNFHLVSKKPALVSLGALQILYPDEAALLVSH